MKLQVIFFVFAFLSIIGFVKAFPTNGPAVNESAPAFGALTADVDTLIQALSPKGVLPVDVKACSLNSDAGAGKAYAGPCRSKVHAMFLLLQYPDLVPLFFNNFVDPDSFWNIHGTGSITGVYRSRQTYIDASVKMEKAFPSGLDTRIGKIFVDGTTAIVSIIRRGECPMNQGGTYKFFNNIEFVVGYGPGDKIHIVDVFSDTLALQIAWTNCLKH